MEDLQAPSLIPSAVATDMETLMNSLFESYKIAKAAAQTASEKEEIDALARAPSLTLTDSPVEDKKNFTDESLELEQAINPYEQVEMMSSISQLPAAPGYLSDDNNYKNAKAAASAMEKYDALVTALVGGPTSTMTDSPVEEENFTDDESMQLEEADVNIHERSISQLPGSFSGTTFPRTSSSEMLEHVPVPPCSLFNHGQCVDSNCEKSHLPDEFSVQILPGRPNGCKAFLLYHRSCEKLDCPYSHSPRDVGLPTSADASTFTDVLKELRKGDSAPGNSSRERVKAILTARRHRRSQNLTDDEILNLLRHRDNKAVVFFPLGPLICKGHLLHSKGCRTVSCDYSHDLTPLKLETRSKKDLMDIFATLKAIGESKTATQRILALQPMADTETHHNIQGLNGAEILAYLRGLEAQGPVLSADGPSIRDLETIEDLEVEDGTSDSDSNEFPAGSNGPSAVNKHYGRGLLEIAEELARALPRQLLTAEKLLIGIGRLEKRVLKKQAKNKALMETRLQNPDQVPVLTESSRARGRRQAEVFARSLAEPMKTSESVPALQVIGAKEADSNSLGQTARQSLEKTRVKLNDGANVFNLPFIVRQNLSSTLRKENPEKTFVWSDGFDEEVDLDDLKNFSTDFNLPSAVPSNLNPMAVEDSEKGKEIQEDSKSDVEGFCAEQLEKMPAKLNDETNVLDLPLIVRQNSSSTENPEKTSVMSDDVDLPALKGSQRFSDNLMRRVRMHNDAFRCSQKFSKFSADLKLLSAVPSDLISVVVEDLEKGKEIREDSNLSADPTKAPVSEAEAVAATVLLTESLKALEPVPTPKVIDAKKVDSVLSNAMKAALASFASVQPTNKASSSSSQIVKTPIKTDSVEINVISQAKSGAKEHNAPPLSSEIGKAGFPPPPTRPSASGQGASGADKYQKFAQGAPTSKQQDPKLKKSSADAFERMRNANVGIAATTSQAKSGMKEHKLPTILSEVGKTTTDTHVPVATSSQVIANPRPSTNASPSPSKTGRASINDRNFPASTKIQAKWYKNKEKENKSPPKRPAFKSKGSFRSAESKASYRNGEIVGASAPEIGVESKGHAMLEKMGWRKGEGVMGGAGEGEGSAPGIVEVKVKRNMKGLR